MGLPKFTRPKGSNGEATPNLYVANCGPAVGLSFGMIASVFGKYGEVKGVYAADESGTRVIVSFSEASSAQAALKAVDGHPCPDLGDRLLHLRYSLLQPPSKELLAAVDARPWQNLAKRRFQHYGYEFCYDTRNVNIRQHLGELPPFVSFVLNKLSLFKKLDNAADIGVDQLTVNEYPSGVGLSPHIDTHSAFRGSIFSLSLAGPCIMEFRKYQEGVWPKTRPGRENELEIADKTLNFMRRAVYLPPRSMLLLAGEARYAWHHYIPHHKIDVVNGTVIRRGRRRVSFTFRKVMKGPCQCDFPEYCESQR